jgi:hypothetical protein
MTCSLDKLVVGSMNIYIPNKGIEGQLLESNGHFSPHCQVIGGGRRLQYSGNGCGL